MPKKRDYTSDIKIELINKGYIILSSDNDYLNMATELCFRCSECDNTFKRTPKSCLKSNPYCVKCTQKIVTGAKLLETKIGDKLSKLTEMYDIKYKIIDNDIICKCRNCDKTYKRKYYMLSTQKHPYLCESCAKRYVCQYKLTSDYVNQKLIDMQSKTTCIESGIFGWKTKVKFRCDCGNIFIRKPNTVVSQKMYRCASCSRSISKNEHRIMMYFEKNSINYVYQKTFDDCKSINVLPFDFYLPKHNTLIEYDGEFHYHDKFGGLKDQQERDRIKTEYCKTKNITLLRIPYFKSDKIEKILNSFIHDNIVPSHAETCERCND